MKKIRMLIVCLLILLVSCLNNPLKQTLKQAGSNREELQKVLSYYKQSGDSMKYRGACFMIENMPGHFSYDSTMLGSFRPALLAYDSLIKQRKKYPKLNLIRKMDSVWTSMQEFHNGYSDIYSRPVWEDVKHISSEYLIADMNKAFYAWQNNPYRDSLSVNDFYEYVLPYRKSKGLCIEDWRGRFFYEDYSYVNEKYPIAIQGLVDSLLFRYSDFVHTFGIMSNYPYLKLSDFSIAKRGGCETKCWFNSMLFSSVGIPVAIDFVPAWGNRNNKHQWNALRYNGRTYPFESFWEEDKWKYKKLYDNKSSDSLYGDFRLAKVYRYSYQTNMEGPVSDRRELLSNIPPLFLNVKKKDVSSEYFEAVDIEVTLPSNISHYAYLCVFNAHNLVPVQWGEITGNKAVFKDMGKDVVYVPVFCDNGVLIPAGPAFFVDADGTKKYFSSSNKTKSITVTRKYPVFPLKMKWVETLMGGKFQGANCSDFSDAVDLVAIEKVPDFVLQYTPVASVNKYRYVRFVYAKGKYGNLAEIDFQTLQKDKPIHLNGKLMCAKELQPDIMSLAFDGSISTFIVSYKTSCPNPLWLGLDLGKHQTISQIGYCPRTDRNNVMSGLTYELFYWGEHGWVSLGTQKAALNELAYENVPLNALFILRCLDEGKEERIFSFEKEEQVWR